MACLLLTNYCFIFIEVVVKYDLISWWTYVYVSLYELIVIMIVWSYLRLVFSDPGYIPKSYAYKISDLSAIDQALIKLVIEENKEEH